jgi:hypothetical protein
MKLVCLANVILACGQISLFKTSFEEIFEYQSIEMSVCSIKICFYFSSHGIFCP